MTVEASKLNFNYLITRTSALIPQEQIVSPIIDEVYIVQRVEYDNESFIGFTDEGKPAKIILILVLQSIYSKYTDVAALISVNNLDFKLLHTWFDCVISALQR